MAKDISGSIRKMQIGGIPFDVMAASNFTEVHSRYENDVVPTSGRNMRKMVRRATSREGVELAANGAEIDLLKGFADNQVNITLSYTTAAGDTYRCTGWIELENRETEENKATVKLFPQDDWVSFVAG